MKSKIEKIKLETYRQFYHSQKQIDLNSKSLNQIICMHGFKKIRTAAKKVLKEAVDTLDLINLSRSTLRENGVSSCAFINLEQVIADLDELNWQDCCITSIQTLNSNSDNIQGSDGAVASSVIRGLVTESGGKRKRSESGGKRKRSESGGKRKRSGTTGNVADEIGSSLCC